MVEETHYPLSAGILFYFSNFRYFDLSRPLFKGCYCVVQIQLLELIVEIMVTFWHPIRILSIPITAQQLTMPSLPGAL